MHIGDIMKRKAMTVSPSITQKKIASLLVQQQISAVRAVDGAGRLLGIVSAAGAPHLVARDELSEDD
jgi:Mg/Co/Ni transporter MgtE